MFLPLAHVLTRVVQFLALTSTSQLIYWKRNPATLLEEIAEAKPTHLPSVAAPLREDLHHAHAKTAAAGGAKGRFSAARAGDRADAWRRRSARVRTDYRPAGPPARLADKLVLSKVRELFGGEIELCLTGAARSSQR